MRAMQMAMLALAALAVGQAQGAWFESKIGLLDPAVGKSDGVVFVVKVLDGEGTLLATLLEKPEREDGFWVIRRDLSGFGGRDVRIQLEVGPGAKGDVAWDWGVWQRPAVRGADGKVLLDMLARLDEAEVGYALDGTETVVGTGAQYNPNGEKDHGLMVWRGEKLPIVQGQGTFSVASFVVGGRSVLSSVVFMHPVWDKVVGTSFARFKVKLPEGDAAMSDIEQREFIPAGFRGEVSEAVLRGTANGGALTPTLPQGERVAGDVDLVAMARWAMQYLENNPSKERGYETRFSIMPLNCPPCARDGDYDAVAVGDTENRMDWEWIFMREMTGSEEGREVEEAIWQRILGYIREDGFSWCSSALLCWSDPAGHIDTAMNWTTGETLVSLVERYKRDGNEEWLKLARHLAHGLPKLASWDTGRAYYEGGLDGWRDGKWIGSSCGQQYASILEPLVRYWELTKDPETLEFAKAFAEGQIAALQPHCGDCRIRPDGSFGGFNSHLHMRPVLGVAHLGAVLGNPKYIIWAKSVYEYLRSLGTDWGWFPETPSATHIYSETCNAADMADVAMWLAKAGLTEYWDHVERYVRNYALEAQWFATPEYEALYREVFKDNPAGAEEGLALMRRFDGGFYACLTPNDRAWGRAAGCMNMMGCCPPEGMRMVYTAWSNTVLETARGVEVNLSFSGDHPAAKVISGLPEDGRLTVIARKDADYFVRPPSWTPRGEVKALVDGNATAAMWSGDHVRFTGAKAGQELTITYPLVEFSQKLHVAGRDYTYQWLGNTVMGVEPKGEILPIFDGGPRQLPVAEAGG